MPALTRSKEQAILFNYFIAKADKQDIKNLEILVHGEEKEKSKAYKALALKFHPDKSTKEDEKNSTEFFGLLSEYKTSGYKKDSKGKLVFQKMLQDIQKPKEAAPKPDYKHATQAPKAKSNDAPQPAAHADLELKMLEKRINEIKQSIKRLQQTKENNFIVLQKINVAYNQCQNQYNSLYGPEKMRAYNQMVDLRNKKQLLENVQNKAIKLIEQEMQQGRRLQELYLQKLQKQPKEAPKAAKPNDAQQPAAQADLELKMLEKRINEIKQSINRLQQTKENNFIMLQRVSDTYDRYYNQYRNQYYNLSSIERMRVSNQIIDLRNKKQLLENAQNETNKLIEQEMQQGRRLQELYLQKLQQNPQSNPNKKPTLPTKIVESEIRASGMLLNTAQMEIAKAYFKAYPNKSKLSRKQKISVDGKVLQLPFSIIKAEDGKLYAIYRGKAKNNRPEGILGKGSYGRVKLAQCLDEPFTIIAAKVQKIDKLAANIQGAKKEEDIQQAVGQYIGTQLRENSSDLYSRKCKYYTFSKFIDGESLTTYFKNNSALPLKDKLEIMLKVFEKTRELHRKQIVHGDLSFNNILYNPKTGEVNIIDFGFANKVNRNGEIKFPIFEQLSGYNAPECRQGYATVKSDIYSLGKWIQWGVAGADQHLNHLAGQMLLPNAGQRCNLDDCTNYLNEYLKSLKHNPTADQRQQTRGRWGQGR